MPDFTSSFWSIFISVIVIGGIIWLIYFLIANTESSVPADEAGKPTGHVWDEDLEELNNPLPRWWLYMFYISIAFSVIYLLLYPGLGSFSGLLNWTSKAEYETEIQAAEDQFGSLYAGYLQQEIPVLAADASVMKTGERLYVNYCATCHGSDARGARGFPNLRDHDWLYGGTPQAIKATLLYGRIAAMPALGEALGEQGVIEVADYVMQLSGRQVDGDSAKRGEEKYNLYCVGCHMPGGVGNTLIGAPNLANNIWLYGGSPSAIRLSVANGRNGVMPAFGELLGEARVHLLTAYIYSLTHEQD